MAFSANIQNLINTSGQNAAITRAAQLQTYVNNLNSQINGIDETSSTESVKSFGQVLKQTSDEDKYAFKLPSQNSNRVFGTLIGKGTGLTATSKGKMSKDAIKQIVSQISAKHGVDEKLVLAVIKQESGFNPTIVSKAGATGLMQLMPATAKGLGVTDPKNPVQNVEGGVKYLKSMLNRFNGNVILALAAYNAGPNAVKKYNGVPPYKETQNYVKSILANYLG